MIPEPGALRLTRLDTGDAVRIELHGDFDYRDADTVLDVVTAVLAEPGGPRDVRVDCTDVAAVDSSGLSTLLMVRRRTDAAGVRLHLDNRSLELERMLKVTGTLEHFTGHNDQRIRASPAVERGGGSKDS
ncbi:STAS domain-containing protein [Streptomyces sp. NPDC058611]|uniref:STAS domain-containing protein n=1 Tax=unclassified Streptomyces TaxID=2593676 RepID=UPI00364E2285